VFLAYFPLLIPLLVIAIPLLDGVFAVIRRARKGRSMFVADKEHIHHRLMDLGHGHRQAVIVMYVWSALAAGAALAGLRSEGMQLALDEVNSSKFLDSATLHLNYIDVAATPQQAVTVARQMIEQDQVKAMAGLASEQTRNARWIVAVGQQRGVPDQGLVVGLMAAMQESSLRNLQYGDRDSLGLFQQRPSQGWGTAEQILDPAYAAAAFFGGPTSPDRNPGLLDIAGWEQLTPGRAAQAVQQSGYPDSYARWEGSAQAWLAEIVSQPGTNAPGCALAAATGSAAVVVSSAARWLGTPYAWGGGDARGPTEGFAQGSGTVGFDCSGLTLYAYAQVGITLPRTTGEQWLVPGVRIHSLAELQPGDLVFFATDTGDPATIHHVAISLGADAMLEAPHTGDVVRITSGISENAYWAPQFIGGLRILR